mgnify:CR=1 FL=1
MKVSECLNNISEKQLGYIKVVEFEMGGDATERGLDTYTNRELVDLQKKDAPAYYNIGEYSYIVANK